MSAFYKTVCSAVIMLFASAGAQAADTTRVLYIGNSFVSTFDVPALVKGLADAAELPLEYVTHAPGGITVGDTAQGNQAHMNNPVVFDLIRQSNWDFVVVQDNQGRFVYNYGLFPSSSKVIEGHLKIRDSVKAYSPCAKMVWFAGWAFKAGSPPYGNNGIEMIDRIWANYKYLNDSTDEIICPIGPAWKQAIAALPGVDPWGPDGAHQSYAGSYLTAATIFTTLFRPLTEYNIFDGSLPFQTASTFRQIAFATVRDSGAVTNLNAFIPDLSISGANMVTQTGFISYQWYKDSIAVPGATNNYYPASPGCYQVEVETASGCLHRSRMQCFFEADILKHQKEAEVTLFPNPASDHVMLNTPYTSSKTISIFNLQGQEVSTVATDKKETRIDVSRLSNGLYTIRVTSAGHISTRKFLKQH